MFPQVFQHPPGKVAHLEQRYLRQPMQALDRRFGNRPGRPGHMPHPIARATSIPRWIVSIHAAQK